MSERKVLNKYYPPDFDPSKIPKLRLPKNRTFNIRLMAPFNMRCNTCGEYIYKGKKFNSRKETVENETYLDLHIYRFYIKCPRCIAEISFKTDPKNTDYELEAGATRNFEALRTAERLALKEQQEKEEEEANNPMKLLEKRTKASQREMDTLETLEDLKEIRRKQEAIRTDDLIESYSKREKTAEELLDEEEKALEGEIKIKFGVVKRLPENLRDNEDGLKQTKVSKADNMFQTSKGKAPLRGTTKRYDEILASIKTRVKSPLKDDVTTQKESTGVNSKPNNNTCQGSGLKLIAYSDSDEE